MNRLFRAAMVAAILPIGLASVGCAHNSGSTCGTGGCGAGARDGGGLGARLPELGRRDWPDRYNYAARQSVVAPFAQQVATGHFLNQTLWNFYFEPTSDKLTPGGMDKLNSLAHATPGTGLEDLSADCPRYRSDARKHGQSRAQRDDLDAQRAATIRRIWRASFGPARWTTKSSSTTRPTPVVHAGFVANAFRGQIQGYRGGISTGSVNVTSSAAA